MNDTCSTRDQHVRTSLGNSLALGPPLRRWYFKKACAISREQPSPVSHIARNSMASLTSGLNLRNSLFLCVSYGSCAIGLMSGSCGSMSGSCGTMSWSWCCSSGSSACAWLSRWSGNSCSCWFITSCCAGGFTFTRLLQRRLWLMRAKPWPTFWEQTRQIVARFMIVDELHRLVMRKCLWWCSWTGLLLCCTHHTKMCPQIYTCMLG